MGSKKEFNNQAGAGSQKSFPWAGKITSLKKQLFLFFVVTTLLTLFITVGVVYESMRNGYSASYLICLLSILFITLIAAMMYFQRTVLIPLENICVATRLMTEGNLETPVRVKAGDEIGKIAELVNDLAINMQEILLFIWNHTQENSELLVKVTNSFDNSQMDCSQVMDRVKEDIHHIQMDNEDLKSIATSFSYFEIKLEHEKMLSDPQACDKS